MVTSPNYPDNYPNSVERIDVIGVEEGLILALQFTAFDIEHSDTCFQDYLKITDGDGTTLLKSSCGSSSERKARQGITISEGPVQIGGQSIGYSLPPDVISSSNKVKIHFRSNHMATRPGWRIEWAAKTPGESPAYWFSIRCFFRCFRFHSSDPISQFWPDFNFTMETKYRGKRGQNEEEREACNRDRRETGVTGEKKRQERKAGQG